MSIENGQIQIKRQPIMLRTTEGLRVADAFSVGHWAAYKAQKIGWNVAHVPTGTSLNRYIDGLALTDALATAMTLERNIQPETLEEAIADVHVVEGIVGWILGETSCGAQEATAGAYLSAIKAWAASAAQGQVAR